MLFHICFSLHWMHVCTMPASHLSCTDLMSSLHCPRIFVMQTSHPHYTDLTSSLCCPHIYTKTAPCLRYPVLSWTQTKTVFLTLDLSFTQIATLRMSGCLDKRHRTLLEVVLKKQFQDFKKLVHAKWLLHYSFSSHNNMHTVKSFILQTTANTLGLQCIHESTAYSNTGFTYQLTHFLDLEIKVKGCYETCTLPTLKTTWRLPLET
jgi:hypothetical protein